MAVRTAARGQILRGQLREDIKARVASLAYSETGKRDLRLDFLRGLAISAMVVDHVGGDTFLTAISGGNRTIVSAAEAFVFLSGLVLGMVYAERIARSGPVEALKGILHRALTLYKASAGVALFFVGLFLLTDVRMWNDRASGLGVDDPFKAITGALTLHYSFNGSDVLVMYTLMLAAAPAVIYLFYRGKTPVVLLGSLAIWAIYQRYPTEATIPWNVANSAFPVAAWQLLFVAGMAAGFHRSRVTGWLTRSTGSTGLTMLGSASIYYLLLRSEQLFGSLPLPSQLFGNATYASLFAKPELGPARVLAFVALVVFAFTLLSSLWVPMKASLGWLLLPLGQSSLYVYIMHLFVVIAIYNAVILVYEHASTVLFWMNVDGINTVAQLIGLSAVWLMVRTKFLFSIVPR